MSTKMPYPNHTCACLTWPASPCKDGSWSRQMGTPPTSISRSGCSWVWPLPAACHPNKIYPVMKTPVLPRRIPDAPLIGAKAAFTRTFTEADVALFIGVTWDLNPYHTDEIYASQTRFKGRIVPGLLTASLLTHLGGLWAFLATSMQ